MEAQAWFWPRVLSADGIPSTAGLACEGPFSASFCLVGSVTCHHAEASFRLRGSLGNVPGPHWERCSLGQTLES